MRFCRRRLGRDKLLNVSSQHNMYCLCGGSCEWEDDGARDYSVTFLVLLNFSSSSLHTFHHYCLLLRDAHQKNSFILFLRGANNSGTNSTPLSVPARHYPSAMIIFPEVSVLLSRCCNEDAEDRSRPYQLVCVSANNQLIMI